MSAKPTSTRHFPFLTSQIADRARLPLIDRGNVRRSFRSKMFGIKSNTPEADAASMVDEKQIEALNRSHRNFVLGLISGLVVLMAIGIADDLSEERLYDQSAFTAPSATQQASPKEKETPPAKPKKNQ
jgi:hypothetical protein